MSKVLVIAAHPDDEILGLGGTLIKRINNGDIIDCLILGEGMTSRADENDSKIEDKRNMLHEDAKCAGKIIGFRSMSFLNLPDNRFDSLNLLDVIKNIETYIHKFEPEIVYTHHNGDRNIDHKITYEAVLTACRPVGDYTVKDIYSFETPSSTEWGFSNLSCTFTPNVFEDITETIEKKLKAMSFYTTELKEYPHPRSLDALEIIAKRWGTVVGKNYAEAFKLIRSVR